MFKESQIEHLFSGVDFSVVNKGYVVASIQDLLHHKFLSKWSTDVNRDISQRRQGRNKLRTYKQFKQVYRTECFYPSNTEVRLLTLRARRCATEA